MARKPKASKQVETLTHEDATRPNIPTAEYQSVMKRDEQDPVRRTAAGPRSKLITVFGGLPEESDAKH